MTEQKTILMQTEPRFAHQQGCCCWSCIRELQRWITATNYDRESRREAENKWRAKRMTFTILQQIEEAEREIKMRVNVYPRWVGSGKMKQDEADLHLARMKSILKTLVWLRDNKDTIKEKLTSSKTLDEVAP
jgi:hypothetical protein